MSEKNEIRKVSEPAAAVPVVKPRADILESPDAHYVVLDVPGVTQDNIVLELDHGVLRVQGERRIANEEPLRYERSFHVPNAIRRDEVSAALRAGVLTVTLPKAQEAQTRRIEVAAA